MIAISNQQRDDILRYLDLLCEALKPTSNSDTRTYNVSRFGRVEDITFERGKIWRMFGTGGRLLSGIPITDIGKITREDTAEIDARATQPIEIMPFGKYKGERLTDIPLNYRQWMLSNFEWNTRNEKLRKSIIATI